MIAIAQGGETVDALAWRVLGRTAGITEDILDANPGLAALGAHLPAGTQVDLTGAAQSLATAATITTVKLWD